jgi:hypothetical protein
VDGRDKPGHDGYGVLVLLLCLSPDCFAVDSNDGAARFFYP